MGEHNQRDLDTMRSDDKAVYDQDTSIPGYITEAAVIISQALDLESEEKYAESVEAYRSAIGKLLSEVQTDPDLVRQAAVKRRVAQYISKAETLVERELDARTKPSPKKCTSSQAIPHLHLFSNLSELRQYAVLDILDGKVILAHHRQTKQKVVFKVLQKSSAVYKKSKTSLLPINIKFMVNLLKYWETDNAVFLMLEYCPAGKLWSLVQPLVQQQLQEPGLERISVDSCMPETKVAVLKPSKSLVIMQEKDVPESTDTDSDLGDMNVVHSENNSLLVISDQQIQHYSMDEDDVVKESDESSSSNPNQNSSRKLSNTERTYNSILDKMSQMETSLKSRLKGVSVRSEDKKINVSSSATINDSSQSFCDTANNNPLMSSYKINNTNLVNQESTDDSVFYSISADKPVTNAVNREDAQTLVADSRMDALNNAALAADNCIIAKEIPPRVADNHIIAQNIPQDNFIYATDKTAICADAENHSKVSNDQTTGPQKLRKLSEMLPQLPDSRLPDSTGLPDRIIRLWAAELVKAITSLHYRDIIIKDLNPDNVLLDDSGHIRLSYQCEWVSVERTLSPTAVKAKFIAPEVLSPLEVTRSADWWSFGAILLLLYTGEGPCSLVPSGLDGTIPISFPSYVENDAVHFVTSFLQVTPERRLGASSTGARDIREHPYFKHFHWEQHVFIDQ